MMSDVSLNPANVLKVLRSLKSKTSQGPDGLPNILLKNLVIVLSDPFAFIFESSFASHKLSACNTTDIIFIDYKKAFASVSHQKLVSKIESYGIRGDLLEWLKAFLTVRTQVVKIHSCTSSNIAIISGVLRGACYSHCCSYYIYTDITAGLRVNLKLFADDAKLYI